MQEHCGVGSREEGKPNGAILGLGEVADTCETCLPI